MPKVKDRPPKPSPGHAWCHGFDGPCGWQPKARFSKDRSLPEGLCRQCKSCSATRSRNQRSRDIAPQGEDQPRQPSPDHAWCFGFDGPCGWLPKDQFSKDRRRRGGLRGQCKACSRKRELQQACRDPARAFKNDIKRRYNLDYDTYTAILSAQSGRCAICRKLPGARRLNIDHDHGTGAIRGLLCSNCNRALGFLSDDITVIAAAIGYLDRHRTTEGRENARRHPGR